MADSALEDRKHRMGRFLMYGGLLAAAVSVFALLPFFPVPGLGFLAASTVLCGYGIYLKKKYCPRCRAHRCDLGLGK